MAEADRSAAADTAADTVAVVTEVASEEEDNIHESLEYIHTTI